MIFAYDSKSTGNKSKNRQRDYIKVKNFCITKETIKRVKSQLKEWQKIFVNHTFDKALISKIYMEHK